MSAQGRQRLLCTHTLTLSRSLCSYSNLGGSSSDDSSRSKPRHGLKPHPNQQRDAAAAAAAAAAEGNQEVKDEEDDLQLAHARVPIQVNSVSTSSDGSILVAGCSDNSVYAFDSNRLFLGPMTVFTASAPVTSVSVVTTPAETVQAHYAAAQARVHEETSTIPETATPKTAGGMRGTRTEMVRGEVAALVCGDADGRVYVLKLLDVKAMVDGRKSASNKRKLDGKRDHVGAAVCCVLSLPRHCAYTSWCVRQQLACHKLCSSDKWTCALQTTS